jgi:hypothetical protein
LIGLCCLVAVGCAQVTNEPPHAAIPTAEEVAVDTAAPPAEAAMTPAAAEAVTLEPPSSAPTAVVGDTRDDSIDDLPQAIVPEPSPATAPPGVVAVEAAEPAVVASDAAPIDEPDLASTVTPSVVTSPFSAEALDFSSLVTRLRKTKAINLRTKIAVKNESDDLLEQFRAYHTQDGIVTLVDLRRSYDSLFLRLRSLLEHADPPLAREIDKSHAVIWELLADPTKFRASDLMAGA